MNRIITLFISTLLAIALASCASPTYYQASGTGGRFVGYGDKQVDGAIYRVIYTDANQAGLDRTYAYAIYRAAELAQSKGATHFEIIEGLIDRPRLERFISKPLKASILTPYYDDQYAQVIHTATTNQPEQLPDIALRGATHLPTQSVVYVAPTYIYVPVQPPPPPMQVSLLIRLLNAPSLDPTRGFDVNDLITRLAPKIIRSPVKTT